MAKQSAAILLYRRTPAGPELLLVHPGGPLWARRDEGAWSLPKGEYEPAEDPTAAARREFAEELGAPLEPGAELIGLGSVRQRSGKIVHAWAAEGDLDPDAVTSNTFELEWPRGSGRVQAFPEIDRAQWFSAAEARRRLVPAQAEFVDRLLAELELP